MCLVEVMDSIHGSLRQGRYCYVASFDIEGAFDNVSHWHLMEGLKNMRIDVHTRRIIHNWLSMRTFQVKMATASGTRFSGVYPITKGLPQGGVLSPLLWLIVFNNITDKLRERREQEDEQERGDVRYGDFIFADDVTMVITSSSIEALGRAAARNVEYLRQILQELSLVLSESKSRNLIFHPNLLPNGIFRRTPAWRFPNSKNRLMLQRRDAAKLLHTNLDFDPRLPQAGSRTELLGGIPISHDSHNEDTGDNLRPIPHTR